MESPDRMTRSGPLSDLVVLDLTRVRSGPTCVRQLADWGASVVKVEVREAEGAPDPTERHGPDFQNLHRNKRSIALDLKTKEGLEILKRLAARADIVVENFRPDVKRRLGIDYESLKAINPRLIYASISGFGQDGPYAGRAGVDQIAQGMSGLMSVTGEPGRGPMRAGIAIADVSAGIFAALGILIALHERERSGEGQFVHTSLLESLIFMHDFQAARYVMSGEVPGQAGNEHPTGVPTNAYKTKDGYVNVAPMPAMWKRFCKVLGVEELTDHPDYATPKARRAHRRDLNALLDAATQKFTSADLIERMNEAGIPCGPIYSMDQTFADPQVQHLGIAQKVVSKALGEITILGQPVTLSRTPSKLTTGAPEYAEHTDEILRELGYDETEVAALRAAGAV
jgi:crotonobetainyl-CoA:carnitine CoA-transferase CaiB-like acyl-CoA transferase